MESLDQQQNRRKSTGHGILKQPSGTFQQFNNLSNNQQQQDKEHITFDEEIIAEHDKSRGTRQKISEPKTPYANEDLSQQEHHDDHHHHDCDVHMHDHTVVHIGPNQVVEEEVKKHLEEAERNKMLNAQLQKEKALSSHGNAQVAGGVANSNFNEQLMQKLDNTQQEQDEEERKHQEFLKKRREHYKNEMKAAMLLKSKSMEEDEEDDD